MRQGQTILRLERIEQRARSSFDSAMQEGNVQKVLRAANLLSMVSARQWQIVTRAVSPFCS